MCLSLMRLFFYLYPHEPKTTATQEGNEMRSCMGKICIFHNLLFVGCLAIVGFWPMFFNVLLACWSYSCYLCIRELHIIAYVAMVTFSLVNEIMAKFSNGMRKGSLQSIGSFVLIIVYGLLIYYSVTYYYYYRISGGIHGNTVSRFKKSMGNALSQKLLTTSQVMKEKSKDLEKK